MPQSDLLPFSQYRYRQETKLMSFRKMALITGLTTSMLVACNEKQDHDSSDHTHETGKDTPESHAAAGAPDPNMFADGALTEDVTTIDCTLSDGTKTSCYRISIAGKPSTMDEGPYCPPTITSDTNSAGSWFGKNGEMIRISIPTPTPTPAGLLCPLHT